MSIRWDTRNKRWRYEFDRVIARVRHRHSRLLPKGWSQAQADAYDRKEGGRLYAVATGVERSDRLIDEAVMRYLDDKQGRKAIKSTTEHLAAIAWAWSGRRLSQLAEVATEIRKEGVEQGRAPATVKQRLAWLKAAARWGWRKHDMAEHDPTAKMQLPEVNNEQHLYYDRLEVLAMAWFTRCHAARILIRASFYSGLRLNELATVEVVDDLLVLPETKNGERRVVPAHPKIRTLLPYLPLSMPRATLHKYLKSARLEAGIEGKKTFHTLRHSTASEMVNAGEDLYTVGQVLGHKDPRSTQRYAHLAARKLAAAVGSIGRKVSNG